MTGHSFNGSAMVVLLSSDLKQVATGYCPHDKIRKFFGGKIESRDGEYNTSEEDVATACAMRELYAEAGIHQSNLTIIVPVHIRRWSRIDPISKKNVRIFQYFFLACLKEGIQLPTTVAEEDEMTDRKFLDILQVLTSWSLPIGDVERINPIHAIGLMRCLHFLEEKFSGDRRFESFFQMLAHLYNAGIHRDSYITQIEDTMLREHLSRRVK